MAKYRVDTDQGSYIIETDEPQAQPPQQQQTPAPSFGQQFMQEAVVNPARQVGAGLLGAAATTNRMGANIFELADQLSEKISQTTGMEKGGLFKDISGWLRTQQHGQEQQAAQLGGGRQDFASQLYRGTTQGLAELPTYAVASSVLGPVTGMAAVGAIRESDRGWKEALYAAAEGALLGKALGVMGPASRPIRLTGAAAMTYAQARLNGADHTTALANATTMGALSGMHGGGVTAKQILQNIPRPTLRSQLNPVEQQAIEMLKARGVHVDAPTQIGSKALRGAGALAENMPLGASVVNKSRAATESGLQRVSGELMQETHPETVTPESSGADVRGELLGRTEKLAKESNVGYQDAWEHAGNPEFTYDVPVRMEPEIGQDGKPTGRMAEVLEPVNMPVDVRDLKARAKPLWEQWQWRPAGERSTNAAYAALDKLLKGPDFISALEAEEGLKGFKSMARTENKSGQRDVAQGTAAGLIPELQERINEAVAHTGDKAIRGLEEGRRLWAEKEGIQDIYEDLPAEPVQAMGRLIWGRDTGIEFLRKVAKETPDQMPKIGRALLEQLFGKATQGGGFSRTAGLLAKWRDVGPETRKILFKDPKLIADLDNFFQAAEMTQRNPNPSGTALVSQLSNLGVLMIGNPVLGTAYLLGGRGLAKALYSPKGVELLTKGLRPQSPIARAEAATQLLHLTGGLGVVEVPGGPSKLEEFLGKFGTKAGKATGEFWREELGEDYLTIHGAQKIYQGVRERTKWAEEMVRDLGESIRPKIDDLWQRAQTVAARVGKDVKRRSMEDLDVRIPDNVRVASKDPTKAVDGRSFHDLELDKPSGGFLPFRQLGPERSNDLVNQIWQEAIQESEAGGGATAAEAVRSTGARPPTAEFWDESFSLPQRARFWYELSGESFTGKHVDLPRESQGPFIDAVAGTSGGVEPRNNLQRAIGITAENLQKQPVMTDLRDPASARNALNPDKQDLETLKYGSFSGTMQHTAGLTKKAPLTTNDVQVASMFGIKGEDIGKNPVMYEVMSRFFLKLRDAQNRGSAPGSQPWETWQMQAPSWVYERIRKNPAKASEYDDYSQVFPSIIKKLQDAGIPTPGGKITEETLMDPRTPNIMSGTRERFLQTPVATVEVATTRTPRGVRAADMFTQLEQLDESIPWVRDAKAGYEQVQRNTMRDLAMRRAGEGSLISQLMSAITGKSLDVSRLDWNGYGTFEGVVNPNLRIPMTGRQSSGAWRDLTPAERKGFLSVLGQDLQQEAMAASHFKTVPEGSGHTYSLFLERYDGKVDAVAVAKFSNDIGFPVNVAQHPNGVLIDINVGGVGRVPTLQQVQDAARATFEADPNVKSMGALARQYAGEYIGRAEYRKAINELGRTKPRKVARSDESRGSGQAGPAPRELSDLERVRQAIQEVSRKRDEEFGNWEKATRKRREKHLSKGPPRASVTLPSAMGRMGPMEAEQAFQRRKAAIPHLPASIGRMNPADAEQAFQAARERALA